MNTHATAGHVTSFACHESKHFPSIAGMIAPHVDLRDRSRSRWNMKHFRQTARGCLTAVDLLPVLACSSRRSNGHCSRRSSVHLVMTGHNARRPRTGRERGLWWRLSEASYLTVWTLNDRFFASLRLLHASEGILRNTGERKLKNRKFSCGVVLLGDCDVPTTTITDTSGLF